MPQNQVGIILRTVALRVPYSCVCVCVSTSDVGFPICEPQTQKNVVFVQNQGVAGAPLASLAWRPSGPCWYGISGSQTLGDQVRTRAAGSRAGNERSFHGDAVFSWGTGSFLRPSSDVTAAFSMLLKSE